MNATHFFLLALALPALLAGCTSKPAGNAGPRPDPAALAELHPLSAASLRALPPEPRETALPQGVEIRELSFESEAGSRTMRLFLPSAKRDTPRGAVLHLHGAGREAAAFCAELALRADVAVAMPETPWETAAGDALAAYNHLCTEADRLGIDPDRICLSGDGVGGLLAVAVAREEFETTGGKPAGLLLFYPLLTLEPDSGESWKRYGVGFGLGADEMEHFIAEWIPDPEERKAVALTDAAAEGMPPTLLVVAECDILRDGGIGFGSRLRRAGVTVRTLRYNGAIHGFLTRPGLDTFRNRAVADAASFLVGK